MSTRAQNCSQAVLTMYLAGALYVPFNDKIELDKRPFWSKSNMEKVTSQIKEHITEARQTNTEIAVDEDAGLKISLKYTTNIRKMSTTFRQYSQYRSSASPHAPGNTSVK